MITVSQLFWAVSIPTVVALVGILLNQGAVHLVETKLGDRMNRLEDRMDDMMKMWQNDVQTLLTMMSNHSERLVKLETHR